MSDVSEAFEQHLRSLSDSDWAALAQRVRPAPPTRSGPELLNANNGQAEQFGHGNKKNEGIQEAIRRGYLDADGKPKNGGTR